ncbi:MAG: SDR family NAD(P)-dependent oxidoreductase [Jiangellales bacterium]
METLARRIALVVGGAGTVGAAVCRALVDEGAQVLIADQCSRVADGTRLANELGPCAQFELLDPSNEREWLATLSDGIGRFGGLDAMVLVQPDATGVALALRTAGPHLARRGGAFVGMASATSSAVLSTAGIPVVEVPEGPLSRETAEALAGAALRYAKHALRTSPRSLRGPAVRPVV